MNRQNILFILLFGLSFGYSQAQQNPLDEANKAIASDRISDALGYFELALNANPNNTNLQNDLAQLYWICNMPEKAIPLYESLSKMPNASEISLYWYAHSLKMNGNYDQSRQVLMALKSHPNIVGNGGHIARLEADIQACDFAKEQKNKISAFKISHEAAINSVEPDFSPVFMGNKLLFSSKRIVDNVNGTAGSYSDPNADFIYIAERKQLKRLEAAKLVHDPKVQGFVFDYNNKAPFSISTDGKIAAVSTNSLAAGVRHPHSAGTDKGALFELGFYKINSLNDIKGATESFPYNSGPNVSIGFPYLADNGKVLYFAAKGLPDNIGGYDLYVSYYQNGSWSRPANLGSQINTPGDEVSPFLAADGALYFSSDYHKGFGGFDVFRAVLQNGACTEIRNLGFGVNSERDDQYFIFDFANKIGYFSSNRLGGLGDYDIYSADLVGDFTQMPKIYELTKSNPTIIANNNPTPNPNSNNPVPDGKLVPIKEDSNNSNDMLSGRGILEKKDKINTTTTNSTANNSKADKIMPPNTNEPTKTIPCADNAYIGVIVDATTKQRLENVWVYIKNNKTGIERKVSTSKYGEFAVILEPQTEYEIRCSRQGFENMLFDVFTGDGQKRTLLGERAMVSAATNSSNDANLVDNKSRGTNKVNEKFHRGPIAGQALPATGYLIQVGVFKELRSDLNEELSQWGNIITEPYKDGSAKVYSLGVFGQEAHAKTTLEEIHKIAGLEKAWIKSTDLNTRTAADKMKTEMTIIYPLGTKATAKTESNPGALVIDMKADNKSTTPAKGKDLVVIETPRESYADNKVPDGFTGRGVQAKEKAVEFKIQIGAYKEPEKANFPDISTIGKLEKRLSSDNGLTYFYITSFASLEDARIAKDKAEQKGITSPFIVAFKNGQKVPVSDVVK